MGIPKLNGFFELLESEEKAAEEERESPQTWRE